MKKFYPPQQRWIAKKLLLCCSFLLLFFTVSWAQPTVTCEPSPITLELDATGNAVLMLEDVLTINPEPFWNVTITGLIGPGGLNFDCTDIGMNAGVAGGFIATSFIPPFIAIDGCLADVMVVDNIDPEFVDCPTQIRRTTTDGNCARQVRFLGRLDVTDNCGPANIEFVSGLPSGSIFPVGTTIVTYRAFDASGNEAFCTFPVIVDDGEDPVIAALEDATISYDANCDFVVPNYFSNVSDNCGIQAIAQDPAPGAVINEPVGGTVDITLTVTDVSGREVTEVLTVTLVDNTLPVFKNCPADVHVSIPAGSADCEAIAVYDTPNAEDNCGTGLTVIQQGSPLRSGDAYPLGVTEVIFRARDAAGNQTKCKFNVIVTNEILPTLVGCPIADVTANTDMGACFATVNYGPITATSPCGPVNPILVDGLPSGGQFPVGTTIVTYMVTDNNGNQSTCTFNVVVTDNEDPVIGRCSVNRRYNVDAGCDFVIPDFTNAEINKITDNCGIASITQVPAPGKIIQLADAIPFLEVKLIVIDDNGNRVSCTFRLRLEDVNAPVFGDCPSSIAKVNDAGLCSAVVTYDGPFATDNCGEPIAITRTMGLASGSAFPIGTTVVQHVAEDAAGNTDTCSFTVIVVDAEDPIITCPADIRMATDAGLCSSVVNYDLPVVSDNCPLVGTPVLVHGLASGSAFPIGITVVEYEVQDAAGNRSVCSFTVTIEDKERPVVEQKPDLFYPLDVNCEFVLPDFTSQNAIKFSDNCDIALKVQQSPRAGKKILGGHGTVQEVIIRATDASGNISFPMKFNVTVSDRMKPIVQLSGTTDVEVNSCEATKTVNYTVQVDDNCLVDLTKINLSMPTYNKGAGFTMNGIPSNPFTFALDLNPDDDGKLSVSYTDLGGNTGTSELNIIVDKNRGACELIKEEIPVCAGITDANTSKEVRWLADTLAIRAYENQTWRVLISNGLYLSTDPSNRLNAGLPLTKVGTADPNEVIKFALPPLNHISGEGYDLILINNLGEMEFISGYGVYPTLEITALEEEYCLGSLLETIVFEADENGKFEILPGSADIITTRSIDNTFEVDINPNMLGIGSYEIIVQFTGQHSVDGLQGNGDKRPGCPVKITAPFDVKEFKLTCNDNVTVKLDNSIDCALNIIPDMLIENTCMNNETIYDIRILDPEGKIANITGQNTEMVRLEGVTPGEYLYIIKVPTLKDSCWGFINIEDKDRPVCIADDLDLLPIEYSCTTADADIKFNELDENDFADCTGIDEVHSFVEKTSICPGDALPSIDEVVFTPTPGWEVCAYYKKNWFADDLTGKTSDTCFQYVFIVRPVKESIKLRTEVYAECSDGLNAELFKPYFQDLPLPAGTGKEITIGDGEEICKYGASKHNDPKRIALCGTDGTKVYKEVNHWTVVDWCTQEKLFDEETQIVEIIDEKAPVLKAGRSWAQTSPYQCDATLTFDPATGTDCIGIDATTWHTVAQYVDITGHNTGAFVRKENNGNGIIIENVPVGAVVTVTYSVEDFCGNRNTVTTTHYAIDDNPPVCIANDELIVGLVKTDHDVDGNGTIDADEHMVGARVYPEDLDDTSYDNCHSLIYQIRKASNDASKVGPWGPSVEYMFSSNTELGPDCVVVEWVDLRITEDRNGNGKIDEGELSTICPSKLTLREDNAPEFTANLDCKWVTCFEEDHIDFDTPEYWGFCSTLTFVDADSTFHCPRYNVGCSDDTTPQNIKGAVGGVTGYKKRTWTLTKDTDHGFFKKEIEQYIYIREVISETFAFPQDIKIECSTDEAVPAPATLNEILTNKGCSEWVMNVTQDTFYGASDACLKIIRNYEFINWCRFDENNIDDNTQINKDCADLNGDKKLLAADGEQVIISTDRILAHEGQLNEKPRSKCIEGRSHDLLDLYLLRNGYFNYTQVIIINDSVDPELESFSVKSICNPANSCDRPGDVEVTLNPTDQCSDATVTAYKFQLNRTGDKVADSYGKLVNGKIVGKYPAGQHSFHVRIDDQCGNFVWVEVPFTVRKECKKPTPIAYATFTAVMENCTVNVWLSDIDASSSDNCALDSLAIELVTDKNGDSIIDGKDVSSDYFAAPGAIYKGHDVVTVSTVGVNIVALWARDAAGNTQFTLAPIYVQDNSGTCGGAQMSVAGNIVNEDDEAIDAVTIIASGNGMVDFTSIFDGSFNVASVPMHSDVTISAEKDINYMNGISTSDLVALQRHVLGIKTLQSAYRLISADVTGDDKVNTRDLLDLQRLILGVSADFANVDSWRFIPKSHVFANPTSPWGFLEAIDFQNLDANVQADFIGVKIGDVTGNAKPTNLLGDDATFGKKQINIIDAQVTAGATTAIEFTAADFKGLTGYQFTMKLADGVSFESVVAGVLPNMSDANFGLNRVGQGIITTSWADVNALDLEDGEVLFTLNVVSDRAGSLSSLIDMTSDVTIAEAYDNDLNPYDLDVQFIKTTATEFALYQNSPNPFDGATTIGFELPQAGAATLKVMDISGKTLRVITGEYNKGYNQIDLSAGDINATGVLYYELTSSNASLTKKMVVIK